eukprot:603322-Pelagomonas_calceolata.AAC.4
MSNFIAIEAEGIDATSAVGLGKTSEAEGLDATRAVGLGINGEDGAPATHRRAILFGSEAEGLDATRATGLAIVGKDGARSKRGASAGTVSSQLTWLNA